MKVTGTFQIKTTNVYPCPPLPVLHTPARKVKSEPKHRDWRVNPIARGPTQHQNRTSNSSTSSSSSSSSSSPGTSPSHSSHKYGSSDTPSSSSSPSPSNHQNRPRITLEKQKFDGVRKIQYINMNVKFANLTMALNNGYQKTQEQAEKRLKMEQTVKENSGQDVSG